MTQARQQLGRRGEDLVAARLAAEVWQIVARNCLVKAIRGELDMVAMDRGVLVLVEVKTMRAGNQCGPETPAAMVGYRKCSKLRALVGVWLSESDAPPHTAIRGDVVALRLGADGSPVEWNHIRAAF
jgi:putative endonuclease